MCSAAVEASGGKTKKRKDESQSGEPEKSASARPRAQCKNTHTCSSPRRNAAFSLLSRLHLLGLNCAYFRRVLPKEEWRKQRSWNTRSCFCKTLSLRPRKRRMRKEEKNVSSWTAFLHVFRKRPVSCQTKVTLADWKVRSPQHCVSV